MPGSNGTWAGNSPMSAQNGETTAAPHLAHVHPMYFPVFSLLLRCTSLHCLNPHKAVRPGKGVSLDIHAAVVWKVEQRITV